VWIALTEVGYQLDGSIGKSFIGIRTVVKNRAYYFLRETIGKIASLATFGIGFVMILSKEGMAIHDHMAKTRVVRTSNISPFREAIVSLVILIGLIVGGAHFVSTPAKFGESLSRSVPNAPAPLTIIANEMAAVVTIYDYDSRGKIIKQGSGFLVSSDGSCVTNFHVIRDAYSSDVKLGDGRLYHVLAVHGYDTDRDVAVIQLGRNTSRGVELAEGLPYLALAKTEVQIGDRIATVGSPEGLSNTVADGLVSAIRGDENQRLLQISAPISPGSSGGPVFNLEGQVVGISSFQLSEGQNLNFAIPIDEVSKILEKRVNLSLEQFYRRFQPSDVARSGIADETKGTEPGAAGTLRRLTGSFLGTVHNSTIDVAAPFGIFVKEEQGTIVGCMAVVAPLFGSGPLIGSIIGANVQFDVTSADFSIRFTGQREKNTLSGKYVVVRADGAAEEGEFVLKKKSSAGIEKFDPGRDCPTDKDINH